MQRVLALIVASAASAAHAAPGDTLYAQRDGVTVRSAAYASARVVIQINKGHKLLEFGRKGSWVNVGVARTGGKDGWVHSSLVGPTLPRGGRTTAPHDPNFDKFRRAVLTLNRRVRARVGADFFTKVENLGDGIVQVTATDLWLRSPHSARQGNLNTLFRLWDAADGSGQTIMVRIIDRAGRLRMQKARR